MAGYRQTRNLLLGACSQGERKLPQTEDTRDNSSMLMLYLLFYAWAMV